MTQTMRRTITNLTMGLALLLASSGTLHAQVNPATVKNQAQNGVNQAQQTNSATQAQVQGQTQGKTTSQKSTSQTAPKTPAQNQTQNSRQGTTAQSNPPAKPPVTTTAKPPVTQGTKPPATSSSTPPSKTAQTTKPPATNGSATQKQKTPAVSVTPPPKTAPKTTPKTAQTNHPATQTPPKTTAKTPAKNPVQTTATRPVPTPARRDPFVTLVGKHQSGEGEQIHLPPGKAGLQVNTLVIQGILSSPSGMIAVVANPQRSVYFLHAGDELFDGRVERIEIDGVTFHEVGKDAFGKPLERQVTRKLNPSLGEQP